MRARALGITLLVLVSLFLWVPDVQRVFGYPVGDPGISISADGFVKSISPKQAPSGIRPGDRFDLARANAEQHWTYVILRNVAYPPYNALARYDVPVLRNGKPYTATISFYPEGNASRAVAALRDLVQLIAMALGILVLWRRPGPATWALFIMLFCGCAPLNVSAFYGPPLWRTIVFNCYWIFGWNVPGAWASIIFALYLLRVGPLPRWRSVVLFPTAALLVLNCALALWEANAQLFASRPYPDVALAFTTLLMIPYLVAPAILIATYFESPANVRERLRWIVGGYGLAAVCVALDQLGSQGNLGLIHESYVTHSLLGVAYFVFVAVPVAYAILKHHIIDANVAISRATVYTSLSVVVVGLFALVDLFFTRALDQKSAGLIADIALALILGFSFNTMHRRVDAFVDRFLFRKRHLAEEHMAAVADAMEFAGSEEHVRSMLTKEPVRAFNVTGARIVSNLTEREDDVRTLAACLQAKRCALRLTDGQWNECAVLHERFAPAVAVLVTSHGRARSIVLYGLHQNGTDLDGDEVAILERLCKAAGLAFDRLEAEALREEVREFRALTLR